VIYNDKLIYYIKDLQSS